MLDLRLVRLAAVISLFAASPALAQTVQERAEDLNDQGKALFSEQKFEAGAHIRVGANADLMRPGHFGLNLKSLCSSGYIWLESPGHTSSSLWRVFFGIG